MIQSIGKLQINPETRGKIVELPKKFEKIEFTMLAMVGQEGFDRELFLQSSRQM